MMAAVLPWLMDNMLYFLNKLFNIEIVVIHRHTQSKMFNLLGIKELVSKQGKSHHRNPMITRLIKTVVSHVGDKSLDVLVTQ